MSTATVLVIAAFSLVVLVSAFAWISLLELQNPLYPRRAFRRRLVTDRRSTREGGWPEWLERRSSKRRAELEDSPASS